MEKQYLTTSELAKILGTTRVTVFRKIKAGKIKAIRIGHNFVIDKKDLPQIYPAALTKTGKKEIEQAVSKTISEYGETLKLLGNE